jgi:hypothetical protein
MLSPDLEAAILAGSRFTCADAYKAFVRHAGRQKFSRRSSSDLPQRLREDKAMISSLVVYLEASKYDVALFVLGYIVFEIRGASRNLT